MNKNMRHMAGAVGLAAALSLAAAVPASATVFSFAGFDFEQDDTPDSLGLLGGGANLGGAVFSSGNASSITQSVGFQATGGNSGAGFTGVPGFDPTLTLGRQANAQHGITQGDGTSCVFGCAINLPSGNNGNTTRHGIEVSWSDGSMLLNGAGDDFVIYESASGGSLSNREGFMVRVGLSTGGFSDWRYEFADFFELYTNTPATVEGATATAFDLSDFGLSLSDSIVSIQIANLIASDRVSGADGQGVVNFSGIGTQAKSSSGGSNLATGALDPDPLYVGIIARDGAAAMPEPGTLAVFGIGLLGMGYLRRRRSA